MFSYKVITDSPFWRMHGSRMHIQLQKSALTLAVWIHFSKWPLCYRLSLRGHNFTLMSCAVLKLVWNQYSLITLSVGIKTQMLKLILCHSFCQSWSHLVGVLVWFVMDDVTQYLSVHLKQNLLCFIYFKEKSVLSKCTVQMFSVVILHKLVNRMQK